MIFLLDFERTFEHGEGVKMVARWWNGKWGSPRLDIWVDVDQAGAWHVTARIGGPEGRRIPHVAGDEAAAQEMVARLKATAPGKQVWRDITDTYRPAPER